MSIKHRILAFAVAVALAFAAYGLYAVTLGRSIDRTTNCQISAGNAYLSQNPGDTTGAAEYAVTVCG